MAPSQIHFRCAMMRTPIFSFNNVLFIFNSMNFSLFIVVQPSLQRRFFFGFFFCLFRVPPMAYGGFQARGLIGAVAACLCHSHSNARSELCLQPTPQLMARLDP